MFPAQTLLRFRRRTSTDGGNLGRKANGKAAMGDRVGAVAEAETVASRHNSPNRTRSASLPLDVLRRSPSRLRANNMAYLTFWIAANDAKSSLEAVEPSRWN